MPYDEGGIGRGTTAVLRRDHGLADGNPASQWPVERQYQSHSICLLQLRQARLTDLKFLPVFEAPEFRPPPLTFSAACPHLLSRLRKTAQLPTFAEFLGILGSAEGWGSSGLLHPPPARSPRRRAQRPCQLRVFYRCAARLCWLGPAGQESGCLSYPHKRAPSGGNPRGVTGDSRRHESLSPRAPTASRRSSTRLRADREQRAYPWGP